ncbi:MAG: M20/M25/M40 family metallo-hydrolase, partial [Calditrichaeota bacterium]|nr:M20/M25/M40 family metallo-hydrolase [Calditrichota bacterium]
GLQPLSDDYLQEFELTVNTFPAAMLVKINDHQFIPGSDYIVNPGSPSVDGEYEVIKIRHSDILDNSQWPELIKQSAGKVIVIDYRRVAEMDQENKKNSAEILNFLKYHPNNPATATVVLTVDKLTWSVSARQFTKPSIELITDMDINQINTVTLEIDAKLEKNYESQNVIALIEGSEKAEPYLVFTAHYDHLGQMGADTYFPGANDNASGVALLLNMAKHYGQPQNKPKRSMLFIAFSGEEAGLIGSKYYVENPLLPLKQIHFLINFDISGTGDDGIQVVNGSVYRDKFDRLVNLNDEGKFLKQVKIRGEACNSDHCNFHKAGVPCFFMYTLGGIKAYHDVYDKAETLPFTEYENYFRLLNQFVDQLH